MPAMPESRLLHPIKAAEAYASHHPIRTGVGALGLIGTVWVSQTVPLHCHPIGADTPESVQAVDCQNDSQGTVEVGNTLKKITVRTRAGKLGQMTLGYFATNKKGDVAMSPDRKTELTPLAADGAKISAEQGTFKVKEVTHFGNPALTVHCPPHNS